MRRIVNLRPDEILDEVTIHSYESGARHQTICFVVHVACSEEALLRTTEKRDQRTLSFRDRHAPPVGADQGVALLRNMG